MRFVVSPLQLVRWHGWWSPKLPPALAILYLEMGRVRPDLGRCLLLVACFLVCMAAMAAYGHVVNDIADAPADRRAGKPNGMENVGPILATALCGLLILTSFAAALIARPSASIALIVALNLFWPTIYSLPPPRLKERGLAGVACDVLGSHITPTLLAIFLAGDASPGDATWFPFAAVAWAAALGTKGILHHQIADHSNDLRSGTVTFATLWGPDRVNRFLPYLNLGLELPISILLAWIVWPWVRLFFVALALYCLVETTKYRLGYQFALTSDGTTLRPSLPFTNESFYVVWAPLAAALQLPAIHPSLLAVPVLHVLLFYPVIIQEARSIKGVAQSLNVRVCAAWRR